MKKYIFSLSAGLLLISMLMLSTAQPAHALVLNKQKYLETAQVQMMKMEGKMATPLAKAAAETNPIVKAIYLAEAEHIRQIYMAIIEELLALHEAQQEQLANLPNAEEITQEVIDSVTEDDNTPTQTPVLFGSARVIRSR